MYPFDATILCVSTQSSDKLVNVPNLGRTFCFGVTVIKRACLYRYHVQQPLHGAATTAATGTATVGGAAVAAAAGNSSRRWKGTSGAVAAGQRKSSITHCID